MDWISVLPHANAVLNGASAALLLSGYAAIRRGSRRVHVASMLSAFGVSVLFLVSYLTYHSVVGVTRYPAAGGLRTAYLALLLSHTLLAALALPLVLGTLYLALRRRFGSHRRLARWTFPIWLYVSLSGVAVYLMLYPFRPS